MIHLTFSFFSHFISNSYLADKTVWKKIAQISSVFQKIHSVKLSLPVLQKCFIPRLVKWPFSDGRTPDYGWSEKLNKKTSIQLEVIKSWNQQLVTTFYSLLWPIGGTSVFWAIVVVITLVSVCEVLIQGSGFSNSMKT